jgi:hypothetical protein
MLCFPVSKRLREREREREREEERQRQRDRDISQKSMKERLGSKSWPTCTIRQGY